MNELVGQTGAWLQTVLRGIPARISAVYIEYTDAHTPKMVHLVVFNAFGFESLANGRFDPSNRDHVGELGEFTWEPPNECQFEAEVYPDTDWMCVLKNAAQTPEVMALAAEHTIQLVVGEHDGTTFVIR